MKSDLKTAQIAFPKYMGGLMEVRECCRCNAKFKEIDSFGKLLCISHPCAFNKESQTHLCCGGAEGSVGCVQSDHMNYKTESTWNMLFPDQYNFIMRWRDGDGGFHPKVAPAGFHAKKVIMTVGNAEPSTPLEKPKRSSAHLLFLSKGSAAVGR